MIGILFGLACLVGWGIADFLAALSSRDSGIFNTLIWSQLTGVLVLLPLTYFYPIQTSFSKGEWVLIAAGILLFVVAYPLFYRALSIGIVAVITPVFSANVLVTIAIGLAVFQERLSTLEIGAIGLVTIGLILAASDWRNLKSTGKVRLTRGLPEAVAALVIVGIFFSVLAFLSRQIGWLTSLLLIRLGSLGLMSLAGMYFWKRLHNPPRIRITPLVVGVVDSTAFLSFNLGVLVAPLALIAPIANSFPLMTIMLAMMFFKELPAKNQWVGIIAVLAGIILLAGRG
jgi:drug/metabolite transporter (DMT)-like permease